MARTARYSARIRVEAAADSVDAALALIPGIITSERLSDPVVHITTDHVDEWDEASELVWHVVVTGEVPARPWRPGTSEAAA
jgi:hypothetical protein